MVLSGDIGGTNTRLQITTNNDIIKNKIIFQKKYLAVNYDSLSEIIKIFLKESHISKDKIESVCIAVAGPVKNNKVTFTNLPWQLTEYELSKVLNLDIHKVKLINDFESIGYGIDDLSPNDLICLQKSSYAASSHGNNIRSMIGAGTGLGMGFIINHDKKKIVYPSEGGHQDFAPVNNEQIKLFQFLKSKLHRVSIERVCSGPGLMNIYKYVVSDPLYNQIESPELKRQLYNDKIDKGQIITKYALEHNDPMALRALDIFISIYGSIAGNLALLTLPTNGLFIVGGIAPKIIQSIKHGSFMNHFHDKGRFSPLMKEFPVYIVKDTDVGLKGAAQFALLMNNKK